MDLKSSGFRRFLVLSGLAVHLCLSLSAVGAGQKVDVKLVDGVTVVRNPKNPAPQPGGPSKLDLIEDLVIGDGAAASGGLFADLRSIGVDDRENIWTLDWDDIKVRVFDKAGTLISAFGTKGQGPSYPVQGRFAGEHLRGRKGLGGQGDADLEAF